MLDCRYLIERLLCSDAGALAYYNEIPPWRYAALPHAFGGAEGAFFSARASTGEELSHAMAAAGAAQAEGKLAWVEVVTDQLDVPSGSRFMSKNSVVPGRERQEEDGTKKAPRKPEEL